MFNESYYLAIVHDGNHERYVVGISQPGGRENLIEVDEVIFWLLKSFQREDWRQERQARRRLEQLALSDEELADKVGELVPSPEDMLYQRILTDNLRRAFNELPPVQAKRFLLHHGLDLSIKQIAKVEHCSDRAVRLCIERAKKNLRKLLR